jgi:3-methyl-2-oxobutanoate hydroxymethyltransferase
MTGLRRGKMQRFVKQYADLAKIIGEAAAAYVDDVRNGTFPSEQHTFASTIPSSEGKP